MLEVSGNETDHQSFIKIKVESRIELYASYVNYEINIETNDPSFTLRKSSTRRRYSDFRILHSMLAKQFSNIKIPELPPKSPFKKSFDMKFVEQRRAALETYLAKLLSKKIFLSSRAFHLFVQSSCPLSEIKDIIEGKSSYVDTNWPGIVAESILPLKNGIDGADVIMPDQGSDNANSIPTSSASCSNSPLGCKKVSFSEHVTVAEIHSM